MDQMVKTRVSAGALSTNTHLIRWVEKMAELCKPAAIHWVDGSQAEYDAAMRPDGGSGTFIQLNPDLWPGCFLRAERPERRREGRGSHLHLFALEGSRRARPTTGSIRSRCARP